MPSIIQKLEDIESRQQEDGHTLTNITADFAHDIAYLMTDGDDSKRKPSKAWALELVETARANLKAGLLDDLAEAERLFIEELNA